MRAVLNLLCLFYILTTTGCSTFDHIRTSGSDRRLQKIIATNSVFAKHHTGFALYDPEKQQWLCRYNADKYFTPASNTKILTMLTCLHVLGDSIEAIRYTIKGDSFIFRGMADPSLLFDDIPSSAHTLNILKEFPGKLYYQPHERLAPFGSGWTWDDYPYTYQVEKSTLPLFGNRVRISHDMYGALQVVPEYFSDYVELDTTQQVALLRDPVANAFVLNDFLVYFRDALEIPFIVSDYEIAQILSQTINRPVELMYEDEALDVNTRVYGAARDTLLKIMMQESDNFIAEQLLMQCAFSMRGTFQTDTAISVAQRMLVGGAPDTFQWVDGSGLSRYNLFTPRSVVWALEQLMHLQSMDYLTSIFAAGGKSGTIKEWYVANPPYIFAKTGTLSNNHCLSGFLKTDSGQWLIFSFMHNNFTGVSAEIKQEMEKVLLRIKTRE